MTTIPAYDPTLFQGAAWHYARYRPKYPPVLFDLLTQKFELNGQGRLLDLGCGAGLIAIPLRDRAKRTALWAIALLKLSVSIPIQICFKKLNDKQQQ
ncbi:methyltransferase [Scytonema sp. PRP1]|uniref:methyltransferase n=1 Tax=Scytonema sp. PRP1 TaxID=3120513 RepID=UPI002FCEC809